MKPIRIDIDLDDVDPNGLFEDQTLGGAGDFTLNGAGVVDGVWTTPDGFAKQIGFESAGNISAVTFTVTGFTDESKHNAVTETLSGPNANTVETSNYFYHITSVAANGAVGTNTEAGPVDEAVTAVIPLNWRGSETLVNVYVTGTISYTVEQTTDNLQNLNDLTFNWKDCDDSALVNATTTANATYVGVPSGIRLKVNSYNSGAELAFDIIQRDI